MDGKEKQQLLAAAFRVAEYEHRDEPDIKALVDAKNTCNDEAEALRTAFSEKRREAVTIFQELKVKLGPYVPQELLEEN